MKVAYDEEVDVLTITLSDASVADSDEVQPGVIFDYDGAGNTIGIELLDASRRVDNPYSLSFDYTKASADRQNASEVEPVTRTAV